MEIKYIEFSTLFENLWKLNILNLVYYFKNVYVECK